MQVSVPHVFYTPTCSGVRHHDFPELIEYQVWAIDFYIGVTGYIKHQSGVADHLIYLNAGWFRLCSVARFCFLKP
jgi:hypothetical protein